MVSTESWIRFAILMAARILTRDPGILTRFELDATVWIGGGHSLTAGSLMSGDDVCADASSTRPAE